MSEEIRKLIDKVKTSNQSINEGAISDFKFDAVKNQLQKALNNNSLALDDITPDKYFIICFNAHGIHVSTVSVSDRNEAIKHINHFKADDNIWKIYVEKPLVDAKVFLRKEWGWMGKQIKD